MHIQALISHYGTIGVGFILFMEMVGIPFPAETTLTLSGIEWVRGAFHLFPLLIAASVGNILGSSVAYGLGRFLGRPVIVRFGKYVGLTEERMDQANALFTKYESPVILVGKFIAGVRVVIPYLAGINKVPFGIFSLYNAISAIVWAGLFIVLGRYIEVEWTKYHALLHRYMVPAIIVAVLLVAAYFAWKVRGKRKARRDSGGDAD